MSGKVGDLTSEQQRALQEFRSSVADVLKPDQDDGFLLKWLRARKFDRTKAEEMLRNNVKWRREWEIDGMLDHYEEHQIWKEYGGKERIGLDKEGCPLHIFLLGTTDFLGILKSVPFVDCIKTYVKDFEEDYKIMDVESKKRGRRIEMHSYIVDLENLSLMRMLKKQYLNFVYRAIMIYEQNYPEMLKRAYLVNASPAATVFYKVLKTLVPADIFEKFTLHTPEETKAVLLRDIDAEVIPAYLGGTRTDADGNPRCVDLIPLSRKVPEEFYMENARLQFLKSPDVTELTVAKGEAAPVLVQVELQGSILQWEFQTRDKDVGFGVLYRNEGDGADEEVVESRRYDCAEGVESGSIVCEKTGTYVLQFDNSYSWIRPAVLGYRVDAYHPGMLEPETCVVHL